MAKANTKEVAKKDEPSVPMLAEDDLLADAAEFEESLGKDDVAIPFLYMLQKMSPAVDPDDAKYVEGSKPGMIWNSVTGKVYDLHTKPLPIIPVHYQASYIEWQPNRGGYVKEWPVAQGEQIRTLRVDKVGDVIQEGSPFGQPGNVLAYTHTHFVFLKDPDTGMWEPAVISMASTQVKYSKKLNATINNLRISVGGKEIRPPRFFSVFEIGSVREENDDGTWYSWTFSRKGSVQDEGAADAYRAARDFAKSVKGGEVSADHGKAAEMSQSERAPDAPTTDGGADDEEIPF